MICTYCKRHRRDHDRIAQPAKTVYRCRGKKTTFRMIVR